jgi:lipopolysaccharide assembly protein A
MKFFQATLLLVFLAALFLFALQNTAAVTVSFLKWSVTAPIPLLVVSVYVLGMLSGWTVVAFLRRSLRDISQPPRRD